MSNQVLTLNNEYIRLANAVSCLYYADKLQDAKLIGLCVRNLIEMGISYEITEKLSASGEEESFIVLSIDEQIFTYKIEEILASCYTHKELEYIKTGHEIGKETELESFKSEEVEDIPQIQTDMQEIPSFIDFKEESESASVLIEEDAEDAKEVEVAEDEEVPEETQPLEKEKPQIPPNWGRRSVMENYEEQLAIEQDFKRKKEEEEAKASRVKPLENVAPFLPTREIHKNDIFFSMFRGVLREEGSVLSEEIYLMVYPLLIEKDNASANIVCYAFSKNENYCQTSLDNEMKNSLIMKVGAHEFLVRGRFDNYKWTSSVVTTGISISQNISFEIIGEYHNSPDILPASDETLPNGHIKFKYVGYVNNREELVEALLEVFPTDLTENAFLIVRRIEDFIDFYYTDELPDGAVPIQTEEGIKSLRCYWEDDTIKTEFDEI